MKTIRFRAILLTVCCTAFVAHDLLAQAPIEDQLDLSGYQASFHHSQRKSRKFSRCFSTDSAPRLDFTEIAVSSAALSALQKICEDNYTAPGGQHFIYGLFVHYGLSPDGINLKYIFEPAICEDTVPEAGLDRSYENILRQGYFEYDTVNNKFDVISPFVFTDYTSRYHALVRISRDGTGFFHQPYSEHEGQTQDDNANCIFFPFQEIRNVSSQNNNVDKVYFYSISKRDIECAGIVKCQKHYIVISPKERALTTIDFINQISTRDPVNDGPFTHHAANLGSLCPVNCGSLTFRAIN